MSEKAQMLRQFNEAFASGDVSFATECVTDDIRWNMVGDRLVEGKEAFVAALESMRPAEPMRLTIDTIVTHGVSAAVNGRMEAAGPKGRTMEIAFCDVYKFSGFKNGKIKEMTSYGIDITGRE